MIQYDRGSKSGFRRDGSGKGKVMMFTVVRVSYLYLETIKRAAFDGKERSLDFACQDKIRLVRGTVERYAGLPG